MGNEAAEQSSSYRALLKAVMSGYIVDSKGNICRNNKSLKTKIDKDGYKYIGVRILVNERKYPYPVYVHRLQAYQKYGDSIFDKDVVCRHLNGDKTDNSCVNICIGTQKQNVHDVPKEIRARAAAIATKKARRFSDEETSDICNDRKKGMTYRELREKYGVSKGTLSYMLNGAEYTKRFLT